MDVRPAVCVAEHVGDMLDGVGVVVCSVVGGIGGVLWYPVRGLMGLGYRGMCWKCVWFQPRSGMWRVGRCVVRWCTAWLSTLPFPYWCPWDSCFTMWSWT